MKRAICIKRGGAENLRVKAGAAIRTCLIQDREGDEESKIKSVLR